MHTVNTHPEQSAPIYAAVPGEQLGVWCLAQGHLSRGIEGGESAVHLLPPPTIPAGPRIEPATFGLQVRLAPLGQASRKKKTVLLLKYYDFHNINVFIELLYTISITFAICNTDLLHLRNVLPSYLEFYGHITGL